MNEQTMYRVAIMLPGITGSLLVSQGDSFDDVTNPVWQAQAYNALNNNPTDQQALTLMEGNLFAGTPSVTPGFQAYAQFASYFKGWGFKPSMPQRHKPHFRFRPRPATIGGCRSRSRKTC